jgi:hypothetical protein
MGIVCLQASTRKVSDDISFSTFQIIISQTTFNCFSVQGTRGRVGDQDTGSPGRPVSSGLLVPGEPGHCRARTKPLGDLPAMFFLQNVLQLHQ